MQDCIENSWECVTFMTEYYCDTNIKKQYRGMHAGCMYTENLNLKGLKGINLNLNLKGIKEAQLETQSTRETDTILFSN